MRLSSPEPIVAALEAGITVFDTARSYEGNEQLLAATLRDCGAEERARIVTKGGMARPGGTWVPDGRAKTILGDCQASLEALDGLPIDLYLIHAPDPRTPWRTSVRALARLVDEGLVRRVGVSNVNRGQLEEALDLAPISAIEVSLSVFDDRALRGGIVERCEEAGVAVIAHSPFGGPRRAKRLDFEEARLALAWLLSLSPTVIAIPGARRPETARSAASAAGLVLGDTERATLERAFGELRPARVERRPSSGNGEIVVVMGIPGAGKSRIAEEYVARGYLRLNRDERGGSLRKLADLLDAELASGARRVVLDNTYLTRASRSYVIDAADRHAVPARCVWLDTPLAQAQVNIVERLLDGDDVLAPTSQMRALRELEPPTLDEGWAAVETVPFVRAGRDGVAGVFVAAAALDALPETDRDAPHLIFDWEPDGAPDALAPAVARLATEVSGPVEGAICPHPAGPPSCWCRPPLPRLLLEFARAHGVDPARSTLVGTSAAHRTLATTIGARYLGS
jgi:aryl-alcohol dehydrogenase-like predicted oxidoreductase/predicted kinase